MSSSAPVGSEYLRLCGITKRFGHIAAVTGVDLDVRLGEVLAIVGDNGAGKSTLMSTLIGLHRPSEGEIYVKGVEQHFHTPKDAVAAGISAVTQDLALVECLDVATNMFIGQTPKKFGLVDRTAMNRQTRTFLDDVKATVPNVRTPVGMLSGGQRQMVAIARALRSGAPLVVMDEPTAALGVRETAQVVDFIKSLRDQGKAVVLVSHDLSIVFEIADRIAVMRQGRLARVVETAATNRSEVVGLITGAIEVQEASVD